MYMWLPAFKAKIKIFIINMVILATKNNKFTLNFLQILFYSTKRNPVYKKYYQILEVSETSSTEQIRAAYLHLVKKYHPDNPDGDLKKFQEIDEAFRKLMQKKSQEEDYEEDKVQVYDIKHTAPQHRQYLSYEGVGSGTPYQREKQYLKMRATKAADNVLQHRISKVIADEKTLMDKKVPLKHNIKTKYGFERLVEDLIQESMSKGEFSNLSGSGKPLKSHQDLNPYVDFVTHKINQVLIDNGFTPEWITLQKEIREAKQSVRDNLIDDRSNFSRYPLNGPEIASWQDKVNSYRERVAALNKAVDKFNLVVPILNKQMLQFNLEKEALIILKSTPICKKIQSSKKEETSGEKGQNIFQLLDFFKTK